MTARREVVAVHQHVTGVRGWGQLAFDATYALTHVVEGMHHEIARAPGVLGTPRLAPTRGVTGLVYRTIRVTNRVLAVTYDAALSQLVEAATTEQLLTPRVTAVRAALNGVVGDHLVASRNPLAIPMRLRRDGGALTLQPQALAEVVPDARRHVIVLVHGMCMSDLGWTRSGHDHGAALERDLASTAVYLHYNTGLHVSTNGRALAGVLEALVRAWPVPLERLTIVGHSMGGLVARSACRYGEAEGCAWLGLLGDLVFLGTPHLGAPLARGVHWAHVALGVSPYTAALALLGKVWSAGAADLRRGYMLDEDWHDQDASAPVLRPATFVPLPAGVRCYAVAGRNERTGQLLGDGLVPVASALGEPGEPDRSLGFPEARRWIAGGVDHFGLLDHPAVYDRLLTWLSNASTATGARAEPGSVSDDRRGEGDEHR